MVIDYLRKKEWSMGNGQCPECCGVPESWFGHPLHMTPDTIGHEATCTLAKSLKELGEAVLMKGCFHSEIEWEHCIVGGGFLSTRHKTKHGCPKYKEIVRKQKEIMDDAILRAMAHSTNTTMRGE